LQAVIDGPLDSSLFSEREKIALAFAEELARDASVSVATFARMRQHFPDEQIVELSAVIGLWCMWNRMVDVVKPDVENDVLETVSASGVALPAYGRAE
jgi:alkylhydroperoxidase family enzyme